MSAQSGEPLLADSAAARGGSSGKRLAARFALVAALVVFDQWSKAEVFARLGEPEPGHRPTPLFGTDWLNFWTSCNPGAAFGKFQQFPYVLVIGRALAVLFLSWLLLRSPARPRLPLVAMLLVLAGALGNLIDNLWTGCTVTQLADHPTWFLGVRDFIDVDFEPLFGWRQHFPAFNVADSCITVGACLWILAGFLQRSEREPAPETAPE